MFIPVTWVLETQGLKRSGSIGSETASVFDGGMKSSLEPVLFSRQQAVCRVWEGAVECFLAHDDVFYFAEHET